MANEIISRDQNTITVLAGITDNAAQEIRMFRVDPVTKRLLISASGLAGGTVTSVSVVTANGISGTVATDTTTPAITLTLGAITPTTVNGLTLNDGNINHFSIKSSTPGASGVTLEVDADSYVAGINTGNDATNSQYSGLAASKENTGVAAGLVTTHAALTTGVHGLAITAGQTLTVTTGGTIGTAAYTASTAYATSTQGTTADNALPKAGGTMTGKQTSAGRDEVGKTYTPSSGSQTVALDCSVNNIHVVTGNASGTAITFTITGATNSQCFIVMIKQGSGTVSTIASWFAGISWCGGSAPTLTATLNKIDTFGFIRTGANTYTGYIIGQNA